MAQSWRFDLGVKQSGAHPVPVVCCLFALLAGAVAWATGDDDEPKNQPPTSQPAEEEIEVGLRGILPGEVPDGLEAESWESLDGNWADWSADTAEVVTKLYEGEGLDTAAQREVVDTLRSNLAVMRRSLADSRYRSLFDPLTTLNGRLLRRVDLAEAVLDTLELTPEKVKASRLQAAGGQIAASMTKLEAHLEIRPGGTTWLPYVHAEEINTLMQTAEDSDAALPILAAVQKKFKAKDQLEETQRAFLSAAAFTALETSIDAYLERAGEELQPLDEDKLRQQLARLVEAAEGYKSNGTLKAAAELHGALQSIRELTPDKGDRITGVLGSHYFGHNFRLIASEEFLSRYVEERRQETGRINEPFMEAWVTGTQTTTAATGVDLKPSNEGARFDLTLNGVVRSSTVGSTSRASIYSSGYHTFVARRDIFFDGDKFMLGTTGTISVNANNTITGASTRYDGGLFDGTARQKAMRIANSRRPRSEATTANKIRNRVLPEFNTEVEKEFVKINQDLEEKWNKRLRDARLEPSARKIQSTRSHLLWSSRVMQPGELGGGTTPHLPPPEEGLTLQFHETLLNNMFDRMNIAGRTMTEAEVKKEIDDYIALLTGAEASEDETNADEKDEEEQTDLFVFAKVDPIRFQFEDGRVLLVIRTGFQQEGKEDIPIQRITVPLTFWFEADQLIIEPGSVRVNPVRRPESRLKQIARAGVMKKKFAKALPSRAHDRKIALKREGKADLVLNVTKISALNGWVTVWAQ